MSGKRIFASFLESLRSPSRKRGSRGPGQRGFAVERLENRSLLAMDMAAAGQLVAKDVDGDGSIAPLDALQVINQLNVTGIAALPADSDQGPLAIRLRRLDADGDSHLTPRDALIVINDLNLAGPRAITLGDLQNSRLANVAAPAHRLLEQLFQDVNAVRANGNVTPRQVVDLVGDVIAALDGAVAPSDESLTTLIDDLHTAEEDGQLTSQEMALLTADLSTVMQEANVPAEEIQAVVDDLNELTNAPGIANTAILAIARDLRLLADNLGNNHPVNVTAGKIEKLVTDIAAIRTAGSYTTDQLLALRNDVAAFTPTGTLPSEETTRKFLDDFLAATSDSQMTFDEKLQLADDAVAALQSAGITIGNWDQAMNVLREIAQDGGFGDPAVDTIVEQVTAIYRAAIANHLFDPPLLPNNGPVLVTIEEVRTLLADLSAIRTAGSYTPAQLLAIRNDVADFTAAGTLPSEETTKKFLDDFVAASSDGRIGLLERAKLAIDVIYVLKSAQVTTAGLDRAAGSVRQLLQNGSLATELRTTAEQWIGLYEAARAARLFGA